ncbi:NfeD family protein [Lunatimonas lonarensis]|uniref:NfeD family protein n=1 Tax=Lunatimonas lonarensis TaxID=1232681 RepID=UPI0004AE8453
MNRQHVLLIIIIFFVLLGLHAYGNENERETDKKKVFVFELKSDIDPRTNRKVKLAMAEAEKIYADLIIIHMDTYGGAVKDADDIRTMILESKIPVYSFIDKDAASAGALISIACDSIYMAPGGSIGAATVVVGGTGEAAPDKYQSYMRSMMRSTAEARGRDPKIAEAMVDEKIEIPGITKEGEVLTFTVSEAIANNFCEAQVSTIADLLSHIGWENHELVEYEPSSVEDIISIFLNPVVSGFLILIIFAGIYFELQTPGIGFPILASVIAIILYFIPYYLTGLAANWEIAVFILGVIFLLIEIFVLPGFGIFGVLGILGILTGLTLGMLPNDLFDFTFVASGKLFTALLTVLLSAITATILLFTIMPKVNSWKAFSRISLATTQQRADGFTSSIYSIDLVGKEGVAHTRLLPSGKILVDDELYDAYSRGEFIDRGDRVKIISAEGTSLRVRKIDPIT